MAPIDVNIGKILFKKIILLILFIKFTRVFDYVLVQRKVAFRDVFLKGIIFIGPGNVDTYDLKEQMEESFS